MKERPIIFNDEMVRAILEGRKTQTRRAVDPDLVQYVTDGVPGFQDKYGDHHDTITRCPFGKSGDRLWVRECFTLESCRHLDYYDEPHSDGRPIERIDDGPCGKWWTQPHYRSTDPRPELWYDDREEPGCRWRPSIHMPRKWSRINMEITGVRVERLQDISIEDSRREGFPGFDVCWKTMGPKQPRNAKDWFEWLWQSIYGADSWAANPWVWVVEFKKVAP